MEVSRSQHAQAILIDIIAILLLNLFQQFIKSQVAKYQDNPYGFHTSLTDRQSEGFWNFANAEDLVADPTLV